ncbi:MAG: acetyl-CoA carboxylase biotin carboxyl carrier protein subunit [Myxococcales bacterium]|nr:acetyl-CoA carboxylase biotin carboxyl carrier protein subunit [Myxococcales bacterium]
MPGTVLDVRVKSGDAVTKGQVLVVIEAMKMEHAVKAPTDGTVRTVHFRTGDRCGPGDVLVDLATGDGSE